MPRGYEISYICLSDCTASGCYKYWSKQVYYPAAVLYLTFVLVLVGGSVKCSWVSLSELPISKRFIPSTYPLFPLPDDNNPPDLPIVCIHVVHNTATVIKCLPTLLQQSTVRIHSSLHSKSRLLLIYLGNSVAAMTSLTESRRWQQCVPLVVQSMDFCKLSCVFPFLATTHSRASLLSNTLISGFKC